MILEIATTKFNTSKPVTHSCLQTIYKGRCNLFVKEGFNKGESLNAVLCETGLLLNWLNFAVAILKLSYDKICEHSKHNILHTSYTVYTLFHGCQRGLQKYRMLNRNFDFALLFSLK